MRLAVDLPFWPMWINSSWEGTFGAVFSSPPSTSPCNSSSSSAKSHSVIWSSSPDAMNTVPSCGFHSTELPMNEIVITKSIFQPDRLLVVLKLCHWLVVLEIKKIMRFRANMDVFASSSLFDQFANTFLNNKCRIFRSYALTLPPPLSTHLNCLQRPNVEFGVISPRNDQRLAAAVPADHIHIAIVRFFDRTNARIFVGGSDIPKAPKRLSLTIHSLFSDNVWSAEQDIKSASSVGDQAKLAEREE